MLIKINEININPGRREASEESIEELVRSISEIGLLNPITIDQEHTLLAGLHRLEAAKRLGWTEIECNVCNLDALQTELAEIDENVVRTALSVIEYGELLERRKVIYESLEFLESVAELKDPTKDCKQSPESFIGEYTAFVENIQQGVEFFRQPNYKEVLPAFSQEQLHTLMRLTDSCCKTLESYLNFVKEICANG